MEFLPVQGNWLAERSFPAFQSRVTASAGTGELGRIHRREPIFLRARLKMHEG